ncbi:hypothetical protein RJZ56_005171 [Blastomyces dermatitidis]
MSFYDARPLHDPDFPMGGRIMSSGNIALKPCVKRIRFYRTALHSSITHVCETLPARTRNPGDLPLDENGLGNVEFNNRHKDWEGYEFAYEMVTVYEIKQPISLKEMKDKHSFKPAPRGLVTGPHILGGVLRSLKGIPSIIPCYPCWKD